MNVFITGTTGYIGGSIAVRLLQKGHKVKGLVRNAGQAAAVSSLGIEPVIGALDDAAVLSAEAARADAVVNAASSDERAPVEILLNALAGSGKAFVHTSGSSVVADDARGLKVSDRIYDEETPVQAIPERAGRAALDKLIRDAADRGVRSVILCNTLIYGEGLGLKRDSIQLPMLVAEARKSGVARHVGTGVNIWSNVHISDVAELYAIAIEKAPAGSFYFVENGQAAFRELTTAIAARLGLGAAQDWPFEQAAAALGNGHAIYTFGSNSRVTADKARHELGWKPTHASVTGYIRNEMKVD